MIYFIQEENTLNIKIGYTGNDDAKARLKALQTGNSNKLVLLATCEGSSAFEKELHARYDTAKVGGEWYRPIPSLLQFIISRAAVAYVALIANDIVDRFHDDATKGALVDSMINDAEKTIADMRHEKYKFGLKGEPNDLRMIIGPSPDDHWTGIIKNTPGLRDAMVRVLVMEQSQGIKFD